MTQGDTSDHAQSVPNAHDIPVLTDASFRESEQQSLANSSAETILFLNRKPPLFLFQQRCDGDRDLRRQDCAKASRKTWS